MDLPYWIVLAPGSVKRLEPTILKVTRQDPEDDRPWALFDGDKGYVAIIDEEPGSERVDASALAMALSKTSKRRTYLVTTNVDNDLYPSIKVLAQGQWKGELKASVEDTLVTLGFRFDWLDGGEKVALRLEAPLAAAKADEAMISLWSVSQWLQMMRRGNDWHILLDGVGAESIDDILDLCTDDDAKVRLLGATMLDHVGHYTLNAAERLAPALATLETLAGDRSKKVRAAAIEARDGIVASGEAVAAKAEFPWLLNYYERYVNEALALLDEERPVIHRHIYYWFNQGILNNRALPEVAVAKLTLLAKTDPRAEALLVELARVRSSRPAR